MSVINEIISLVEKETCSEESTNRRAYFNRMLRGDCIDLLRGVPNGCVDLVVTDPPYGAKYRDRAGRTIINDDNTNWIFPAFAETYRVLKPDAFCVSFYGWHKVDDFMSAWRRCGFRPVGHFTWVKTYSSHVGFSSNWHESAYLLAKGRPEKPHTPPPDVLAWKYSGNKLHPTQKPVSALRPLIEAYSRPGDLILDPFGGSGSTAVAARLSQRQFLVIEKDEQYFEAARGRLLASPLQ